MRPRNRSILERLTARSSSLAAILFAACGTEPAGPGEEVVTASFETSASFSGLSFPTVRLTGTVCKEARYSLVPSPEDVAYYFAMRYAREAERALQTLISVGPAYVGAMVAKGHAEVSIVPYFNQP